MNLKSAPRFLKYNRFLRGLYNMFSRNFSNAKRSNFGYISESAIINPPIQGHIKNIYIYDKVGIGPHAFLSTPNAKIIFKGNTSVAEHLTIHTGNHARKVGTFVSDITEKDKPKGYDHDVIIEEDVWIGSNVTILEGVTIGRGSTVAAGAVVNKNVPPYSIVGGVPAKVIKFYWSVEQILEHEKNLYPENERYTREELEKIINE